MSLHLIKLSVGSESAADLEAWYAAQHARGEELMHITRSMPRRAAELLEGGSIYWVIRGLVCARQRIMELRPVDIEDVPHCAIVLSPEFVHVAPRPHRPFQGWRYLQAKDIPPDLTGSGEDAMPEEMRQELARLGLL